MDTQATRKEVIQLVNLLPETKLQSARDYLAFLYYTYEVDEANLRKEDELWERTFAEFPEQTSAMAREAREAYLAGNTTGIDDDGEELKPAP